MDKTKKNKFYSKYYKENIRRFGIRPGSIQNKYNTTYNWNFSFHSSILYEDYIYYGINNIVAIKNVGCVYITTNLTFLYSTMNNITYMRGIDNEMLEDTNSIYYKNKIPLYLQDILLPYQEEKSRPKPINQQYIFVGSIRKFFSSISGYLLVKEIFTFIIKSNVDKYKYIIIPFPVLPGARKQLNTIFENEYLINTDISISIIFDPEPFPEELKKLENYKTGALIKHNLGALITMERKKIESKDK